ncbi:Eco57I restriction-modification methylase domain-containing protein, partial [Trueperella pyogenes]
MLNKIIEGTHNPDVLTCIANLSNDEVFTPPETASAMLDLIADAWAKDHDGENIWSNPDVTFIDPFTKSGIFLREITQRLTDGLVDQIPDLQERVNHILTKQVFGIGITNLTALLARRSVYCSKSANGKHSICTEFNSEDGNIWFERTEHTWAGGTRESRVDPLTGDEVFIYTHRRCSFCGAGEDDYGRGDDLETHAYAFIHASNIKERIREIFGADMHFDVICGNPPYQLSDGGGDGSSAMPIYHKFVEQAKLLDPSYLTMIIPARWFTGGKGLDSFRESMLSDSQIVELHDYIETGDVFDGLNIRGGICYFLWKNTVTDLPLVVNHRAGSSNSMHRSLTEPGLTSFIRHNQAISILRKVRSLNEPTMDLLVSSRLPFGIPSNFSDFSVRPTSRRDLTLHRSARGNSAKDPKIVFISRDVPTKNLGRVSQIKVLVSKASPGGDDYPHS